MSTAMPPYSPAEPADAPAPGPSRWRPGRVIWFDARKGFGYLQPDDDIAPVFVEYRSIDAAGYRTLFPGQKVLFVGADRAGGPEAVTVRACDRPDAYATEPVTELPRSA